MVPAIPIAVAAAAGLVGYLAYEHDKKPSGRVVPVPPITNVPDHPRTLPVTPPPGTPMPQPIPIGVTKLGNVLHVITPVNPDTGKPTVVAHVATSGKAAPAAHDLFDYLKGSGIKPTASLKQLVTAFQTAHNTDPESRQLMNGTTDKDAGKLEVNGNYDLPTSAALTLYTGDPIAPDPSLRIPSNVTASNGTGTAALTSSNLYAYLKIHGNVNGGTSRTFRKTDANLWQLVKQFQHSVNTDPKFPGPVGQYPSSRLIKNKLSEDGIYGKGTSDALAVTTFERINP